jgi:hypothetical protein
VLNPDCPPKLAVRLIASMSKADLDDVIAANGVPPEVRAAAEMLVRGR